MRDSISNLIARLRNASRQERLYVALGVVVALFTLRFGVQWFLESRAAVKEDIQLSAERLANARARVGRGPEVQKELDGLRTRFRDVVSQLIPGDSPTLAAASLQERVSALAAEKNVSLQTTQVMKDEAVGPFRKVSLRITASSELKDFADFLSGLEYGPLRVSVPFIEVTRRGAVVRGQTPRAVSATLEISGMIRDAATQDSAKPAKGGSGPSGAAGAAAAQGGSGGVQPVAGATGSAAPSGGASALDAPEGGGRGSVGPRPNIPQEKRAGAQGDPLGGLGEGGVRLGGGS